MLTGEEVGKNERFSRVGRGMRQLARPAVAILAALTVGCASQAGGRASSVQPAAPPAASQYLVVATYAEPGTVAGKALGAGTGTAQYFTRRAFNATLGIIDGAGHSRPYLAETLPQLDSETWRTFPDGRMETTYRLRAGLNWHDGSPLAADDFVFAWQVYSSPQVGIAKGSPQSLISDVTAPDPQTVVIIWKRPYPNAGTLDQTDFPPLPRHILQAPFENDPGGLDKQPFWTLEYVGAGPYRLIHWEPGAYIDGEAFDGDALGKPKIQHVRINFMNDTNAVVAALLAGDIQVATDIAIKFEQGLTLEKEWTPQGKGRVLIRSGSFHGAYIQQRPDIANPRALLDVRVRKALAYIVSRQDINDVLFEGQGVMTEVPYLSPGSGSRAEAEQAVVKYPYDPRTSEQLMTDAGFVKGSDGLYTSPTEGPLHIDLKSLVSSERQKEQAILSAAWRKAGFDFSESTLPPAQSVDLELRATYPAMFTYTTGAGEYSLAGDFASSQIGSPSNRWVGTNRGGFRNDEFDRLSAAFGNAIAPGERTSYVAQMARVATDNLPVIPSYFELEAHAFAAALHGPEAAPAETIIHWNIHEWEFV